MSVSELVITVVSARELYNTEMFMKMDPYCKVIFGSQIARTEWKEKAHKTPVWNKQLKLPYRGEQSVRFEVWDHDKLTADDFIGSVDMVLAPLLNSANPSFTGELNLVRKNGKAAGFLYLSMQAVRGPPGGMGMPPTQTNPGYNTQGLPPPPQGVPGYGGYGGGGGGQAQPPFAPGYGGGGGGQAPPPFAPSGGGGQAPPPFGPLGGGNGQAPPPFAPSGGGGGQAPPPFNIPGGVPQGATVIVVDGAGGGAAPAQAPPPMNPPFQQNTNAPYGGAPPANQGQGPSYAQYHAQQQTHPSYPQGHQVTPGAAGAGMFAAAMHGGVFGCGYGGGKKKKKDKKDKKYKKNKFKKKGFGGFDFSGSDSSWSGGWSGSS
uniref:C2 domain-containing protein n=1 Tax=Chromera velia CCMP2878 TaxID=1169474 RepID=A0A0G4GQM9_9ALVE|eukprot:Cvel_5046.t1-p1 / transcript=Cvel_5046.t1 / gene=Cvel_5046 / organism=Chromera_velia_CCMP2878 / gene_product=hypothetical protein / transcript_product=hypothetical protein / location=Cvel_scaffold230:16780-19692(-) / protein_length=373 / sequence_SO=supercontig / SO=protein_coding / is_pseudo=false